MKKLLSFILSVLLIASMVTPAAAAETGTASAAGYLTIFAVQSGPGSSGLDYGHVFLEFTNTSGTTQTLGGYDVDPTEGITFGFWSSIGEYSGLFYNAESYLHHEKGRYGTRASITIPLNQSDIYTISNTIELKKTRSYNGLSYNCVDFALDIWYSVCDDYAFSTGKNLSQLLAAMPGELMDSMMQFSDCDMGSSIVNNDDVNHYGSNGLHEIEHFILDGNSSLGQEENHEIS